MKNRTRFALVMFLLIVLVIPAISSVVAQDDVIELRLAWWGSQNRHDRTIAVIEMFEELHPNIRITYEPSGWNDHWTKLATQAAADDLPDIIQQDYARLAEWVSRDLLLPLDDFVEDGTIDTTFVADASLDGGRVDGLLYAINLGNNSQAFLLDLNAFEEAGLELPDPQWTWPDFEAITLELYKELGIWGMGPGMYNDQLWKSLYMGYGEWSYNDEGTALGYEDDQPLIEYMEMLLRLQEVGAIPTRAEDIAEFEDQGVEAQPIVTGRSAMIYFWSNQITAVWTASGEDRSFKMWPLPRPEGGQSQNYIKPSQFFSITQNTEHPEEAAMFIDFFTNSLEANEILMAERGVPISSEVREGLMPLLGPAQIETFDYLSRIEADSSPIRPPDPPGHGDIIDNVYNPLFIDMIMYGEMSAEEGVQMLREEAELILRQNR